MKALESANVSLVLTLLLPFGHDYGRPRASDEYGGQWRDWTRIRFCLVLILR